MKNKVFVIGFNKTGTTSMTEALTKLGFKFCPEYVVYNGSLNYFQDQISKKYDSLFKLVDKYDAFEDRPWNHTDFYKELDKYAPNSKFILTIRDVNNWLSSYERWGKRVGLKNNWYYNLVSNECYGIDDFLSNKEVMKKKYEERNQEIMEYFKDTNKLFVMDIEKNLGWKGLCEFLDKPIPTSKFPNTNKKK